MANTKSISTLLIIILTFFCCDLSASPRVFFKIDKGDWKKQDQVYLVRGHSIMLRLDSRKETENIRWFQIIPDTNQHYKNANFPWEKNPYKWLGFGKINYIRIELFGFRDQLIIDITPELLKANKPFDPIPKGMNNLYLIESPLVNFETKQSFDLITCVHGFHYIGEKLAIIKKYIRYLKQDALFAGNLDTNNILDKNGNKLGRKINSVIRIQGIEYDTRKKIIKCNGPKTLKLPFQYLGADDKFGKNYTGQKVVSSYYNYLD